MGEVHSVVVDETASGCEILALVPRVVQQQLFVRGSL